MVFSRDPVEGERKWGEHALSRVLTTPKLYLLFYLPQQVIQRIISETDYTLLQLNINFSPSKSTALLQILR